MGGLIAKFSINPPMYGIVTLYHGGGGEINIIVAYLGRDDITGEVVCNVCVKNNCAYNYTNSDQKYIFTCKGIDLSHNKFSTYSIFNAIQATSSNQSGNINYDDDFTLSAWMFYDKTTQKPTYIERTRLNIYSGSFVAYLTNVYYNANYYNEFHVYCWNEKSLSYNPIIGDYSVGSSAFKTGKAAIYNDWVYMTICKKDALLYYFVNGALVRKVDLGNYAKIYFSDTAQTIASANMQTSYNNERQLYIDDLVCIKGQCLWTEDFTVPTEPLLGDLGYKHIIYPYNMNENDSMKIN